MLNKIYVFLAILLSIVFGRKDSSKEVFVNYEQNSEKIYAAVNYYKSFQTTDCRFFIDFYPDEKIWLSLRKVDSSKVSSPIFDQYGVYSKRISTLNDLSASEYQEPMRLANTNITQLDTLREYLRAANCYSIGRMEGPLTQDNYVRVGYQRDPWIDATLYYMLFEEELSDSLINYRTQFCNYKKINNKVLVQYSADYTFGNDCFPDK